MKIKAVENRSVMGRKNDLLAELLRKSGDLLQQSNTQLGVEGSIDIINREE